MEVSKLSTINGAGSTAKLREALYMLCVCGIQSSDGKTDHAVCIFGNWIFDSNFKKALPLNMESLNLCSSSADQATTFVRVTRGHLLRKIKK
jgi:hypothetical protein